MPDIPKHIKEEAERIRKELTHIENNESQCPECKEWKKAYTYYTVGGLIVEKDGIPSRGAHTVMMYECKKCNKKWDNDID